MMTLPGFEPGTFRPKVGHTIWTFKFLPFDVCLYGIYWHYLIDLVTARDPRSIVHPFYEHIHLSINPLYDVVK